MAGVVGGTASKLGGGKFANGAVTGAFVHMFNAEMTKAEIKTWNDAKMRQEQALNTFKENMSATGINIKHGFVNGLKATSAISGVASIATASIGQVYASGLFFSTGYASDYLLLYIGELPPQSFFNNIYLDSTMYPITSRYHISGGLTNLATKSLVNE